MSDQMEADYRRDQQAIRAYYAAAQALRDFLGLHRPLSHDMKERIEFVGEAMEKRAEQIQAVWN